MAPCDLHIPQKKLNIQKKMPLANRQSCDLLLGARIPPSGSRKDRTSGESQIEMHEIHESCHLIIVLQSQRAHLNRTMNQPWQDSHPFLAWDSNVWKLQPYASLHTARYFPTWAHLTRVDAQVKLPVLKPCWKSVASTLVACALSVSQCKCLSGPASSQFD